MKNKDKGIFIIFTILGSVMLIDAIAMFFIKNFMNFIKEFMFGIAIIIIGIVYFTSSKKK